MTDAAVVGPGCVPVYRYIYEMLLSDHNCKKTTTSREAFRRKKLKRKILYNNLMFTLEHNIVYFLCFWGRHQKPSRYFRLQMYFFLKASWWKQASHDKIFV